MIACLILFSCGGDEPTDEEINAEETEEFVDNPDAEETAADTSSTGVYQEEVSEEPQSLQEAMASENQEEEEGGMSFCDCVKKNKELQDIMMADGTSDADFDKAMEEMEALKEGECKKMFPNQSNIEEVKAHKRKVAKCLK